MTTEEKIRSQIAENPVIVYMKGTPEAPECGFSAKAATLLKATGVPFAYVNVLQSPFIYERLPAYSRFPTFPQVFIGGELVGGSDIVEELSASGELIGMIRAATAPAG
jgi:monothiol glutaredoxin